MPVPSHSAPLTRVQITTIIGAIGSITVVGIALSLSTPLISLLMAEEGETGRMIGLNAGVGSLAILVFGPFVPRIAAAWGVRPLLFTMLALGAISMAAFPLLDNLAAWFILRFLLGGAIGTLFVLSEFWIAAAAPIHRRGLVMGAYATALSTGFAIGPFILTWAGAANPMLFYVGGLIFATAAVPILIAGGPAPPIKGETSRSIWSLIRLAPIATVAALAYGAIEQGAFAFLVIYGQDLAFSAATAALFLTAFELGNLASQIPIGLLSDRINRPALLLACAGLACLGALAMPLAAGSALILIGVIFLTGGLVGGIYTVGLAHLGARFSGSQLAAANAAFVMLYSLGMMAGAPAVGFVVDAARPHGYAYSLAGLCGAYALLIAWRMRAERTAHR